MKRVGWPLPTSGMSPASARSSESSRCPLTRPARRPPSRLAFAHSAHQGGRLPLSSSSHRRVARARVGAWRARARYMGACAPQRPWLAAPLCTWRPLPRLVPRRMRLRPPAQPARLRHRNRGSPRARTTREDQEQARAVRAAGAIHPSRRSQAAGRRWSRRRCCPKNRDWGSTGLRPRPP